MSPEKRNPATRGDGAFEALFADQANDNFDTPNRPFYQPQRLRDYQQKSLGEIQAEFLKSVQRVAFALPTGGGKTVVLVEFVNQRIARSERVLLLVHRQELLSQTGAALRRAGIAYGVLARGVPSSDHAVQLAMVGTIARRLDVWRNRFDCVVVDEAHHAVAGSWASVLASQPRAKVLGVTATPERLDGRGLAEIFETLIVGPSVAELIAAGFLAPLTVYEPARPNLDGAKMRGGDFAAEDLRSRMGGLVIGAAVAEYRRLCPGAPAIAFCIDRKHSQDVAAAFVAAGFRARHLDGDTPAAERAATIADLAAGRLDVITNCGLISEGLDVPNVVSVLMLRPTASSALFLQQAGRALRPAPGKTRAIILDFAGNCTRHGLPDAPRDWSLDAKPRRQRENTHAPRVRKCRSCSSLNQPRAFECTECGADLKTPQERREIEIKLAESRKREAIEKLKAKPFRWRLRWAGADRRRLELIREMHGYNRGWVFYQMERARAAQEGGAR